ncbi:MAG: hypothetical protein QOG04_478 [Actinomycetota bacterium]|jgi:hypothetical protein|nr:hypothetical protein [Actinomycetota bacterium]
MSSRATHAKSPAQSFALAFGVVFLLVGILGFILAPDEGDKLFGVFQVNLLHNIIHLAVGALFLVGSGTHVRAKQVNLLVGIVYGLVAILGFANIVVQDLLDANAADDFLHLATAVLALYFGTAGAEGARPATT